MLSSLVGITTRMMSRLAGGGRGVQKSFDYSHVLEGTGSDVLTTSASSVLKYSVISEVCLHVVVWASSAQTFLVSPFEIIVPHAGLVYEALDRLR